MYFSKFPQIIYDFDLSEKTDYRLIKDITKNIRFRKLILENIYLYEEYEIQEGDTAEILAEKIYGSPYYHWVIMLANQRYDHVNDFPLTQHELDRYIERKYGVKSELPHHYEKNGFIVEATNIMTVRVTNLESGGPGAITVGELLESVANKYLARVDQIIVPSNNITAQVKISLREGKFVPGELLKVRNENTYITADSISVPSEFREISNYEYEYELNESKRKIKVISPRYLDQIFKEFENILE